MLALVAREIITLRNNMHDNRNTRSIICTPAVAPAPPSSSLFFLIIIIILCCPTLHSCFNGTGAQTLTFMFKTNQTCIDPADKDLVFPHIYQDTFCFRPRHIPNCFQSAHSKEVNNLLRPCRCSYGLKKKLLQN